MIEYLRTYFRPEAAEPDASLAISGGLGERFLPPQLARACERLAASLWLPLPRALQGFCSERQAP